MTRGFFEYFWMGRLGVVDWFTAINCTSWLLGWWLGIIPKQALLALYVIWRLAYNVGLGWILREQSRNEWFSSWVQNNWLTKHSILFNNILQPSILTKLDSHYQGEKWKNLPIGYKTWLVFRMTVDLVLFHDFCHFWLFALAYNKSHFLDKSFWWTGWWKVMGGLALLWFNWWVKSDAHRVVKDYAWYWGDFFFRLQQGAELTFDGVFELAPHPMYSLGYVWYYGIALICSSYVVFYVSLAGHCLQLAFLVLVETPHMDKIYPSKNLDNLIEEDTVKNETNRQLTMITKSSYLTNPHNLRESMVLFWGFNPCQATDLMTALLVVSTLLVHWWGDFGEWIMLGEWILWRVIFCGILGYVLWRQDRDQAWTRHYYKKVYHNDVIIAQMEAFKNWKALYNFTLLMNWTAFILATWRCYQVEHWWGEGGWTSSGVLLRHTLGILMILLQVWTSWSIYETLGPHGWFYGDFFFFDAKVGRERGEGYYSIEQVSSFYKELASSPTVTHSGHGLTYDSGVYRYLNNPEKVVGQAAYFGLALMAGDWRIAGLAVLAMATNYAFLEWVERPHMERIYGVEKLRKESGMIRAMRKLPVARVGTRVVKVGERMVEKSWIELMERRKKLEAIWWRRWQEFRGIRWTKLKTTTRKKELEDKSELQRKRERSRQKIL